LTVLQLGLAIATGTRGSAVPVLSRVKMLSIIACVRGRRLCDL